MNRSMAFPEQRLDAHALMKDLSLTRRVFHSEADFQHAFAWLMNASRPLRFAWNTGRQTWTVGATSISWCGND